MSASAARGVGRRAVPAIAGWPRTTSGGHRRRPCGGTRRRPRPPILADSVAARDAAAPVARARPFDTVPLHAPATPAIRGMGRHDLRRDRRPGLHRLQPGAGARRRRCARPRRRRARARRSAGAPTSSTVSTSSQCWSRRSPIRQVADVVDGATSSSTSPGRSATRRRCATRSRIWRSTRRATRTLLETIRRVQPDGARRPHVDAPGVRPLDDVDGRRDPRRQPGRRQRRRQAGGRAAPPRVLPRLRHRRPPRCGSPTSTARVNGSRATSSASCRCSSARRCSARRSRSSATAHSAATACTSTTCVDALAAAGDARAIGRVFNVGHPDDAHASPRSPRRSPTPPAARPACDSSTGPAIRRGSTSARSTPAAPASPPPSAGGRRSISRDGLSRHRRLLPGAPVVPVVDLSRRGARFAGAFAEVAERIARRGSYLLGDELEAFERELAAWIGRRARRWRGVGRVGAAAGARRGRRRPRRRGARAGLHRGAHRLGGGRRRRDTRRRRRRPCHRVPRPRPRSRARTTPTHARRDRRPPLRLPGRAAAARRRADRDRGRGPGAWVRSGPPDRSRAVAYSFYPTKNLGGIGDGGAVVTDDAALDAAVRLLRAHGMSGQYVHEAVSQNFRMSEIEAAWLRLGLPALAGDVDAAAGDRGAVPGGGAAAALAARRSAARVPPVRVPHARPRRRPRAPRVGTASPPRSTTRGRSRSSRRTARCSRTPCPEAEAWAAECVSVPCFPELTDDEVERVASALAELPTRT